MAAWFGHLGDTTTKWDNGFYTECNVLGVRTALLVDSGSTATLISTRIFEAIQKDKQPKLIKIKEKVRGANGSDIQVSGIADIPLQLGGICFFQTVIVCNILPDGILGQDFMLKFASRIDYKKMLVETSMNTIPCWIGGEAESVSHVLLSDTITVPPMSSRLVSVQLPNADRLTDAGLITASKSLLRSKDTYLVEGVIATTSTLATAQVINVGEVEAKLFSGTPLGICESFYDNEHIESVSSISRASSTIPDTKPSEILPAHLQDLWTRSTVHLSVQEGEVLADLLNRYQHIFAKSSEDLGRTDRVKHRINTGTAVPSRQPPRRQPIYSRRLE